MLRLLDTSQVNVIYSGSTTNQKQPDNRFIFCKTSIIFSMENSITTSFHPSNSNQLLEFIQNRKHKMTINHLAIIEKQIKLLIYSQKSN